MKRALTLPVAASLAAAFLLACPAPAPQLPERITVDLVQHVPTKARDIPRANDPVATSNVFGFAEMMVRRSDENPEKCRLADYGARSFAWRGSPHVWVIRNGCGQEVEVEVSAFERRGRPDDPFREDEEKSVKIPRGEAKVLHLTVRENAARGIYVYTILIDGDRQTYSPDMGVRDPDW